MLLMHSPPNSFPGSPFRQDRRALNLALQLHNTPLEARISEANHGEF